MNLTALLVLTTLYLSVSGGLPSTSSVKMVEIWLLATLFVPFVEVILHVYMDSLRVNEPKEICLCHGRVSVKNYLITFCSGGWRARGRGLGGVGAGGGVGSAGRARC